MCCWGNFVGNLKIWILQSSQEHEKMQAEEFNKPILTSFAPSDYLLIKCSNKGNFTLPYQTRCEVPGQIIAQFRVHFGNSNFRGIPPTPPPFSTPPGAVTGINNAILCSTRVSCVNLLRPSRWSRSYRLNCAYFPRDKWRKAAGAFRWKHYDIKGILGVVYHFYRSFKCAKNYLRSPVSPSQMKRKIIRLNKPVVISDDFRDGSF